MTLAHERLGRDDVAAGAARRASRRPRSPTRSRWRSCSTSTTAWPTRWGGTCRRSTAGTTRARRRGCYRRDTTSNLGILLPGRGFLTVVPVVGSGLLANHTCLARYRVRAPPVGTGPRAQPPGPPRSAIIPAGKRPIHGSPAELRAWASPTRSVPAFCLEKETSWRRAQPGRATSRSAWSTSPSGCSRRRTAPRRSASTSSTPSARRASSRSTGARSASAR